MKQRAGRQVFGAHISTSILASCVPGCVLIIFLWLDLGARAWDIGLALRTATYVTTSLSCALSNVVCLLDTARLHLIPLKTSTVNRIQHVDSYLLEQYHGLCAFLLMLVYLTQSALSAMNTVPARENRHALITWFPSLLSIEPLCSVTCFTVGALGVTILCMIVFCASCAYGLSIDTSVRMACPSHKLCVTLEQGLE